MRKSKPTQIEIVLRSLVEAGERGLSSYRAYDPNFPVKRLPARIYDLQQRGCLIESWGSKEARYILRQVPLDMARKYYRWIPGLMAYVKFRTRLGEMTREETDAAVKAGKLVRVFDDERNEMQIVRV